MTMTTATNAATSEAATTASSQKTYCNCLARERGLDPAGYAGDFDSAVLIETALPWKDSLYSEAGALPQEVIDLLALWRQRYMDGLGYRHGALMIAPDKVYSQPGHRRVIYCTRPEGAFAHFSRVEYLVPEALSGALIWALHEAPDDVPRFDAYRVPNVENMRDLLVCTHGTVDAACAKFGYPLYKTLRTRYANENLRVWRVSHFGGHVFAPTLVDMPTGHYWAYVEDSQAEQIAEWRGDVEAMRGFYRGWTGAAHGFMQAAEREMWQRHGWAWFAYHKLGEVVAQDADEEHPAWAEIRMEYAAPDGSARGMYEARIEVSTYINTEPSTNDTRTYDYPQYIVTRLNHAPVTLYDTI